MSKKLSSEGRLAFADLIQEELSRCAEHGKDVEAGLEGLSRLRGRYTYQCVPGAGKGEGDSQAQRDGLSWLLYRYRRYVTTKVYWSVY